MLRPLNLKIEERLLADAEFRREWIAAQFEAEAAAYERGFTAGTEAAIRDAVALANAQSDGCVSAAALAALPLPKMGDGT